MACRYSLNLKHMHSGTTFGGQKPAKDCCTCLWQPVKAAEQPRVRVLSFDAAPRKSTVATLHDQTAMSSTTAATVIQTIVYSPPKQGYGTTTTFASSYLAQGPVTYLVTWTNLGPLTTTYTAPSSCSTTPLGGLTVYSTDTDGWIDSSWPCDWMRTGLPSWVHCQPSANAYSSLLAATTSPGWMTYLSPGLYCPSNYSTAVALTLNSQDIATRTFDGFVLRTTGTHVYCCPRLVRR